ncbi:MAG: 2-C-methyl-D-erythritol 2,4-cyclodiphosphate synthase [Kiritimatiellia bacterium]|jgi:2-C-methyl-D-erythritol 2,4-cyclodiphosphate synthase|nr:2-C-methyl-D-erythritol 2,4-cyclodiphosphate synthase [Kiritimatiellia bacterium]MDP6848428.1 2-C-methyl-D-erythritol 2,4-cyclodiphosphate synthase [Kiritimatiellia bacterium]
MIRTGIGFDAHRFSENRDLILGGVKLDHETGLLGHSDADVVCHAIADALLGAIAAGDIGTHFPDTDPAWKDACSLDILAETVLILGAGNATVINVDCTVIAERPKIAPHIALMREKLADAIGVEAGSVSVKATTVEKMGALGREEGIAALAIATVEQ